MTEAKVVLRPILDSNIPVNASAVTPDKLAGKSLESIRGIRVWHGNRRVPLSKVFEVSGKAGSTPPKTVIEVDGDIPRIRHLGEGMTAGKIIVRGNAGMHLGARMKGGSIEVYGNVDHWLGAEMQGGAIRVEGNVGDKAASAYLGSKYGMNGGTLYIRGNAGSELGMGMRRGIIVVEGDAGAFTGTRMLAGTIFVRGRLGERTGAAMGYKGLIIGIGRAEPVLPTLFYNGEYETPLFLRLLMDAMEQEIPGFSFTKEEREGPYLRFTGDFAAGGRGEVYLLKKHNTHQLEEEHNGGGG